MQEVSGSIPLTSTTDKIAAMNAKCRDCLAVPIV
jgi:hypothetical protein